MRRNHTTPFLVFIELVVTAQGVCLLLATKEDEKSISTNGTRNEVSAEWVPGSG